MTTPPFEAPPEAVEKFDNQVKELISVIDKMVDNYWEEFFPKFGTDHPLKLIVAAAFMLATQQAMTDKLRKKGKL